MGNCIACGLKETYEQFRAKEMLKEGCSFTRKRKILGIANKFESIYLQLNSYETHLEWQSSSIALIEIKSIEKIGSNQFVLKSKTKKIILHLCAATTQLRDLWYEALDHLIEEISATTKHEHDADYWREREVALKASIKDAQLRKSKYATVGMKYTAQAMAKAV